MIGLKEKIETIKAAIDSSGCGRDAADKIASEVCIAWVFGYHYEESNIAMLIQRACDKSYRDGHNRALASVRELLDAEAMK